MTPNRNFEQLGLYAVAPFVFAAAIMWLAPYIVPQWVALNVHTLVLAYAGIVAAFFAGAAAHSALGSGSPEGASPYLALAFIAWIAIWPSGFLFFTVPAAWRYLIIMVVFIWLMARGTNSAYGAVQARMTFWICLSLFLIMARLISWRQF
jgi:hypothetical protein